MKATTTGRTGRGKIAAAFAVIVALTAGFFAFAPSAFAHHPEISGDAVCEENGTFTVNWTVGNSETSASRYMLVRAYSVTPDVGTTTGLTADGSYSGIVGPAYSGPGTVIPPGGEVTATTSGVPGDTTSITLSVTGFWKYSTGNNNTTNVTETRSFTVELGERCTPPKGSMSISKVVTGNSAPPGATYTINYDNGAGTSGSVTVQGGETETVDNLPYGSYTLSEVDAPPGATISPNPAVVGDNSPEVEVTVTNPYPNVGSFSVKKQVTGETGGYVPGSTFVVGYSCSNGANGSLTLTDGETESVGNLPVGTTCTLGESSKPATSGPSYVYGPESWDPSNNITIGSTSNVSVVLTNPIVRIFGGFSVTKQVTGATDGYVPGSEFEVSYDCTNGAEGVLALTDGDTEGVGDLPIGTVCTLDETTKPSTSGPSYVYGPEVFSPSNVVTIVENDDDNVVQVALTNPIDQLVGSFSVTKDVTGETDGYVPGSTFTVSYDCDNGAEGVLTLADGETETVNNLPVGTTCTLSETTKPSTTGPSYVYGPEVFTPSATVNIGSTSNVSVTLTNPIERRLGGISVTKNLSGAIEGYDEGSTFGFTLDCPGDEYDQAFTLEAGDTETFTGIPLGTTCTVAEVSIPEPVPGYEYGEPVLDPADGTVTVNSTTEPVTVTVENPLVWLPAASASIVNDCESGGALVTLNNNGGGDVVFQIVVDGVNFGPTLTVGSEGEQTVLVPLDEDQDATVAVEAEGFGTLVEEIVGQDCQNPAATFEVECAEEGVVVTLTNDGESPAELTVSKDGEEVDTVTVGDTPVDVLVPMDEDETATITVTNGGVPVDEQEITFDCVPPDTNPPASVPTFEILGTQETPLPQTGSNVFGMVALAAGLILAGATLIGMTRRRS